MSQEAPETHVVDLIKEIEAIDGVCFDPDKVTLHGLYSDELSAHRARRGWVEILEANFFLDKGDDFAIEVSGDADQSRFVLTCNFISASARYAFWRLTHNQVPEAQYLIETAHVPSSTSGDSLAFAPDLISMIDDPAQLKEDAAFLTSVECRSTLQQAIDAIRDMIRKFV